MDSFPARDRRDEGVGPKSGFHGLRPDLCTCVHTKVLTYSTTGPRGVTVIGSGQTSGPPGSPGVKGWGREEGRVRRVGEHGDGEGSAGPSRGRRRDTERLGGGPLRGVGPRH